MPFPAARRSPPSHPLSLFGCSLSRAEIPGWRGRIDKSISNLARCSVCGMAMRFIFIVTPWLFFRQIFVPCFDCYDFEAAATHEVGHLLGLSHPDRAGKELHAACTTGGARSQEPSIQDRSEKHPSIHFAMDQRTSSGVAALRVLVALFKGQRSNTVSKPSLGKVCRSIPVRESSTKPCSRDHMS